ncbi:unnamed protein product [Periconia digitata]|uniref:NmrA-like domain-containing protein n=1 Tax=Periconia digitata TaxID=1303443 RepID=A0A9W4XL94_9PLEO|nr:unnamed protein product [Periconia digitata]
MSNTILVFGAAGGVGRWAAQSAADHGAKVFLAMRNTQKTIPGLTASAEQAAGFQRIQADLSIPSSLTTAVQTSGATIAFVYAVESMEDRMKSAFETLKKAGIEFVVFLSAYAVQSTADEAIKRDMLPRMHAEMEINLRESGINYVSLRPAYFNTNLFFMQGYKAGVIRSYGVDAVNDFIAPEDIGAVAGTLLTSPPEEKQPDNAIYLCGPKLMRVRDAIGIVGEVLGKEIEVKDISEEDFARESSFFGKDMLESMTILSKKCTPPNTFYPDEFWGKAVGNLKKFGGKEPMGLKAWVEVHKDEFQ